jgi:hypothetical protein
LVVGGSGVDFGRFGGDRGVAVDHLGHDSSKGF